MHAWVIACQLVKPEPLSPHCLHTGLHSNTTAFLCCLLRLRVSRHKLSTGLAACIGRGAIMARKKNASRKAAQHSAARNLSKASKTPPVTIQSLPPDLISRILFLTGQPAAFATVCRYRDTCKGQEGSCTCSTVRQQNDHANGTGADGV